MLEPREELIMCRNGCGQYVLESELQEDGEGRRFGYCATCGQAKEVRDSAFWKGQYEAYVMLLDMEKASRIDSTGNPYVMCREDDFRELLAALTGLIAEYKESGRIGAGTEQYSLQLLARLRI